MRVHCFLNSQSLGVLRFTIQKVSVAVQEVELLLKSIDGHSVTRGQILLEIHICEVIEVVVRNLIVLIRDYRLCLLFLLH